MSRLVYGELLMSRTIVITGATGFIGGMLARRLESSGWRIRALVRPASFDACVKDTSIEWCAGELEDRESLQRLVANADFIVHCAGAVRGAVQADFNRVNVDGTARLVEAAAAQKALPRFLLISSLAAREPQLSPYASSKRQGERVLSSCAGNMFWGILRPPPVYGPGDQEMRPLFQWMLRGIAPLIGSDQKRVSLLYIDDLADAIIGWLQQGTEPRQHYELHDGHPGGYSWQQIIEVVERLRGRSIQKIHAPVSLVKMIAAGNLSFARLWGAAPMLTPGKVRELTHSDWVADNNRISTATGWSPRVSLAEGLRQTFRSVL